MTAAGPSANHPAPTTRTDDGASESSVRLGMIWAQAHGGVIGDGGAMPWHLPEDLAHFREVTRGSAVIMGRRTWESLPERFRPLPGRRNIVVTRNPDFTADGAYRAASLDDAVQLAAASTPSNPDEPPTVWIIGGGQLYRDALPFANVLEVTDIDLAVDGDTRAPTLDPRQWVPTESDPDRGWHRSKSGLDYRFTRYERRQSGSRPAT